MPKTISPEEARKKVQKVNNTIIRFTNIDDEDFRHKYDGVPYEVEAGESLMMPFPVGDHLAKHLAMKMLKSKKKKNQPDGRKEHGKTINYYNDKEIGELKNKILSEKEEKPVPEEKSDGEKMKEKTEAMNEKVENASVDKKQVIKELKERGIDFNPRDSKEELLELIKKDEAQE